MCLTYLHMFLALKFCFAGFCSIINIFLTHCKNKSIVKYIVLIRIQLEKRNYTVSGTGMKFII